MRWAVNVERMETRKIHVKIRKRIMKGREHFEDNGVDGRLILKLSSGMGRGLD